MQPLRTIQLSLLFWNLYNVVESIIPVEEYRLMPKVFQLDSFDDCMELGDEALYCMVTIQLGSTDLQNQSQTWKAIHKTINDPRYFRHDKLRHGVCIPETCPNIHYNLKNKVDAIYENATCDLESCSNAVSNPGAGLKNGVMQCYNSKYEHLGLKVINVQTQCQNNGPTYPIDNVDVAVGIAMAILVCIVAFASLYEGRARYKSKEEYDNIINTPVGNLIACFSLPRNWERLRGETTDKRQVQLKCLNGIRFCNLLIVITAHVGICTVASSIENPPFIENLSRRMEGMLFLNCLTIIQTFMLISGFLMVYNHFVLVEKGKKFSWTYVFSLFVSRFIRLTPGLIVMIALQSSWFYHSGKGPNWDKGLGIEYRNCRQNWWANILYFNNYYDVENMCMLHTWYLATDMQLYIVSLLVLALMWKYPNRIKLILALAVIIGFALPGVINFYNNYDIVIRMYPEALYTIFMDVPQWHAMYSSSAVNFGAYALGMACGYTFCKRRHTKTFTNKFYVVLWWILGFSLPLSVVLYGYYIYQEDYEYTRLWAATYVVLYRALFAIGICIIMYGSEDGIGWFARDILKWEPFQVLGRLTYSIYLVHVVLIRMRAGQSRVPMYLSYYTLAIQVASDTTLSIIFAVILALFVELPVSALERLSKSRKKQKTVSSVEDISKEQQQRKRTENSF